MTALPTPRRSSRSSRTTSSRPGGQIVTVQAVQKGQTDMKPVLTVIANAPAPDVLYFPIFTAEGAFVIAQSKEVAGLENTALIGSDGMFSQDMVNGAGPAAVGVYLSSPAVTGDAYQEFLAKYEDDQRGQATAGVPCPRLLTP